MSDTWAPPPNCRGQPTAARGSASGCATTGWKASALEPLDPTDPADTVEAVHALLRSSQRPTAIAAASDMLAVTAYEAIRAAGLVVGRDVAVVGCHDIPLCRILTPALTSVRLPLRTIASGLVARLLAQIRGERAPGQGLLLPGELVVRASSSRVVEA